MTLEQEIAERLLNHAKAIERFRHDDSQAWAPHELDL